MRLPEQVEVIVYRFMNHIPQVLLCRRVPERGGFWQPLTGGVESTDVSRQGTALRELHEEIGVDKIRAIKEVDYQFEFWCAPAEKMLTEYVFMVEIEPDQAITLSDEHDDFRWCSLEEALELLQYDTNKEALKKAFQSL